MATSHVASPYPNPLLQTQKCVLQLLSQKFHLGIYEYNTGKSSNSLNLMMSLKIQLREGTSDYHMETESKTVVPKHGYPLEPAGECLLKCE